MAKSLRSKIKNKHREVRRQAVYAPVIKARTERLAAKEAVEAKEQAESLMIVEAAPPVEHSMDIEPAPMTKLEKERWLMSANAFKKKQRARSKSRLAKRKGRK